MTTFVLLSISFNVVAAAAAVPATSSQSFRFASFRYLPGQIGILFCQQPWEFIRLSSVALRITVLLWSAAPSYCIALPWLALHAVVVVVFCWFFSIERKGNINNFPLFPLDFLLIFLLSSWIFMIFHFQFVSEWTGSIWYKRTLQKFMFCKDLQIK